MPNASIRRSVVGPLAIVTLAVTVLSAVAQAGPTVSPTATPTPTPDPTLFPCSEQGIQAAITIGGGGPRGKVC